MLGTARQVRVTKEETTIVDGRGDAQEIKNRISQIKLQIEETTSIMIGRNSKNAWQNWLAV